MSDPVVVRFFKFAHLAATIGLVGSLGLFAALALWLQRASTIDALVVLQAMSWSFTRVTLPSIALLWITGLLSLALRPALLECGWVWAKMILGMALAGIAFIGIWRTLQQPSDGHILAWLGAGITLGLAGSAVAVWRPRLWGGKSTEP